MSIEMTDGMRLQSQNISIKDRQFLSVTGVEEVESFDENGIILRSNLGMMAIDGAELHISSLSKDTGELFVEGKIGGVVFFEPRSDRKDTARGKKGAGAGSKKSRGFFG